MTTMLGPTAPTSDEILEAASSLVPEITGRAQEIEAARRVPRDLLDALVGAGCFKVLLPRSHGGAGGTLADAMQVFEELSRADASVGWTVMIGSSSWCDLAALPRASFDALFAGRGDVIFGGAFNPTGVVAADRGGFRVRGRWSFASGCQHCDWLFANCIEDVAGDHRMRTVVVARDDAVIEDTWFVSGLRGTGSHHFRLDDVVVPADHAFVPFVDEPSLDEPVVRIPPPALFALEIAAVALGTARGALEEITALAASKVPLLAAGPLVTNPTFHVDLATADTAVRAARGLLYEHAEEAWQIAATGAEPTPEQRARLRAAAAWVTERAVDVVTAAYRAGGGSSLYDECPLQRRLRDAHAITQHFLVRADTLRTAGALLVGQELDVPVF